MLVATNSQFNFEAPPGVNKRNVSIKVTDSGVPPLSFTDTLTVYASDVNESPSNITVLGETKVYENITISTHVAQLWADNPEMFRQELTFTLQPPSDYFEVVKTHGPHASSFLVLKKTLDYGKAKKINLHVKVEDNGSPKLSTKGNITIDVLRTDPCITGKYVCSKDKTECSRKSKTEYMCTCVAVFEMFGGKCVPIDECRPSCDNCEMLDVRAMCKRNETEPCGPCANEGTCVDHHNNYTCNCKPGFTGKDCYININECEGNPCNTGMCIDQVNGFVCDCSDSGFNGEFCEQEINECLQKPCFDQTNQPCTDLVGGFLCNCSNYMSGSRCERKKCPTENDCLENEICHSVDLTKARATQNVYRCINEDKLSNLEFNSVFAPLKGISMEIWQEKFESFLRNDINIPLGWLHNGGEGTSKLTDFAVYHYMDSSKRIRRDVKHNTTTSVSFYGVYKEEILTPPVLLYSINNACERNIYCSKIRYNDFKCKVCDTVNITLSTMKKPYVLASLGQEEEEDDEWMSITAIVGIVMFVLLLTTLIIYIYRRRSRNNKMLKFNNRSEDEYDVREMDARNTIEIMERRSSSWDEDENGVNHFSGVINPMYGADEDEVDNNVVNTLYRKTNPDGTVRVKTTDQQPQSPKMFDNPLFGNKDIKNIVSNDDDWESNGFSNPNFTKPESEL